MHMRLLKLHCVLFVQRSHVFRHFDLAEFHMHIESCWHGPLVVYFALHVR